MSMSSEFAQSYNWIFLRVEVAIRFILDFGSCATRTDGYRSRTGAAAHCYACRAQPPALLDERRQTMALFFPIIAQLFDK